MVYAYDLWAQMPVKDLYDTLMMQMAIGAAKDMYEKGIQEYKDFLKQYGDYFSYNPANMKRYGELMGGVQDIINNAYSLGIDLFKSPEGRMIVSQAISSVRPEEMNDLRRQAAAADAYIKSREKAIQEGYYDPEYERYMLGGHLLEDWDGSRPWTATSVSPYKDYEKKYGHLFEGMGFEYDQEESKKHPGMMVMTKNKDRMHNILSTNRPDLVNDPQYQYDLNRIAESIRKQNPYAEQKDIEAEAIKRLETEIVERNYKGGMQMVEDPILKREWELKLENVKHNYRMKEKEDPDSGGKTSYGLMLALRGIDNYGGLSKDLVKVQTDAYKFGNLVEQEVSKIPFNMMGERSMFANKLFKSKYTLKQAETQLSFISRFDSKNIDNSTGEIIINEGIAARLYDPEEVFSNTLGYEGKRKYTDRLSLSDFIQYAEDSSGKVYPAKMITTGDVYSAPTKNFNNEQYVEVKIIGADGQAKYKYYKIFESEPVATVPMNIDGKTLKIAPNGLTITPSERSSNWFSIEDNMMNTAAGLASETIRKGQGEYINK